MARAARWVFHARMPVSVGAAGVSGDQKPGGVAEAVLAHLVPPAADRVGGELGGVGGVAY